MKIHKSIRFSYEANYFIQCLINEYEDRIATDELLIQNLEQQLKSLNPILKGVYPNLRLNVSYGSVIEEALSVYNENKFTNKKWEELEQKIFEFKIKEILSNDDVIPKVYFNEEVLSELEKIRALRRREGKRLPLLSYIIKILVFNLFLIELIDKRI